MPSVVFRSWRHFQRVSKGPAARRAFEGFGGALSSKRNTADGPLLARPEGVPQSALGRVAVLDKSPTLACERRLAENGLGDSESTSKSEALH